MHTPDLTPRALMRVAMRRQATPRIPTMAQLTHDTALRIYAAEVSGVWLEGLHRCLEDPSLIYRLCDPSRRRDWL